jgi:protoporphyrinogen oxidase
VSPVNDDAPTHSAEEIDVAIVGGGPAGMATAYQLRDSPVNVKVFERADHVGGRTKTALIAGKPVNAGAVYVYRGTATEQLCSELDIGWLPVEPMTFGIHYRGETVVASTTAELVDGLPLTSDARTALAKTLSKVEAEYAEYSTNGDAMTVPALGNVSFREHLGTLQPDVMEIIDTALVAFSHANSAELSAQYAMRYFSSYLVHDKHYRGVIPGGMQEICTTLLGRLENTVVSLNACVYSIEERADGCYDVYVTTEDGPRRYIAGHVVLAIPGPLVASVAPGLPDWKLRAIERIKTPASATLCVVLDCAGRPEWEEIHSIVCIGTAFQLAVQPETGPAFIPRAGERTYFALYGYGEAFDGLGDDTTATERWLEDFYKVLPAARGRVLGTELTRWKHGFSYPGSGREQLVDEVRAPVSNVHFAGDYASATAGMHGAFEEAQRVNDEIVAALNRPKRASRRASGTATRV